MNDRGFPALFAGAIVCLAATPTFSATITATETSGFITPGATVDRPVDEYVIDGNTLIFSSDTAFSVNSDNGTSEANDAYADQNGSIGLFMSHNGIEATSASWAQTVTNDTGATTSNELRFGTGGGNMFGAMNVLAEDGSVGPTILDVFGSRGLFYDVSVNGVSVWSSGIEFILAQGDLIGTPGVDLSRSHFTVAQTGVDLGGTIVNDGWIQNQQPQPPAQNGVFYSYQYDANDFVLDLGNLGAGETLEVVYSLSSFSNVQFSVMGGPPRDGFGFGITDLGRAQSSIPGAPSTDRTESYAFVVSTGGPVPVPIPAALPLLGFGVLLLGMLRRNRARRSD